MHSTVVYDGDCGFCTWTARTGMRVLRADVTVIPWQRADLAALGLDRDAVTSAVQWIAPGTAPLAGHRAIAAWLIASGLPWSMAGRALLVPPVSWLAARIYLVIARNRQRIPGPWRKNGACKVDR